MFPAERENARILAEMAWQGCCSWAGTMMHTPRSRALVALSVTAFASLFAAACGGGSGKPASGPNDAEISQSKLMSKTFAGKNKCDPANHTRPFIIEWDATDMSSFQSFASDDVVLVKYEGCNLQVLEGCKDDSMKGSLGSYKPATWTSGGVETVDVADEGELYAKLPLGAASLAPRVESGEKFHMEYYVSGTRNATRDKIYKGDLSKNPACAEATHFVYGYNLGAFALASKTKLAGEVGGSYFGFGAGAKKSSTTAADKKGGDLSACAGDSAREVDACKVPIRLTLRPITDGANPDGKAAQAEDTPESLNLAGKLKAETDREKKAQALLQSATTKMNAKDGKGCIAELDQHDRLDPRPLGLSTNPEAGWPAVVRSQCLMASGQCTAGKTLFRRQAMKNWGATSPDKVDTTTDAIAGQWCQGGSLTPRDQFLKARMTLQEASSSKKEPGVCKENMDTIVRLMSSVKPKDEDDVMVKDPERFVAHYGPACFAKAGDCQSAFDAYKKGQVLVGQINGHPVTGNEPTMRASFDSSVPRCKDALGPDPAAVAAANRASSAQASAAALQSASTKLAKKDGSCLADLDTYDRAQTDAAQKTTNPSAGYAQTRAMCLMLAGKCDEGERLQRATLRARNVSQNIIDLNAKSMRDSWCK